MNVTTAEASPRGAGFVGRASSLAGHGVRGSDSMRGTAVSGWGRGPVGLKKWRPSKWSLCDDIGDIAEEVQDDLLDLEGQETEADSTSHADAHASADADVDGVKGRDTAESC